MDIHCNPGPLSNSEISIVQQLQRFCTGDRHATTTNNHRCSLAIPHLSLRHLTSTPLFYNGVSTSNYNNFYLNSMPLIKTSNFNCRLPAITYSRSKLFELSRKTKATSSTCDYSILKELNIFRYRGKRSGQQRKRVENIPAVSPDRTSSMNLKLTTQSSINNNLTFSLLNARSINNKSLLIKDYVVERDIDIFAITETWLKDTNSDYAVRDICPTGYLFCHVPRLNRFGGGVGVLYKNSLKMNRHVTMSYISFEFMELLLHHKSSIYRIVVVYRPPSSNNLQFFNDFTSLLERLVTSSGKLLICGDFNYHVNDDKDYNANCFMDLLDCFNLTILDSVSPTHKSNHVLDLIITRSDEESAKNLSIHDPVLSDHYAVHCMLHVNKPLHQTKTTSYRKLRTIDVDSFRQDIKHSVLFQHPSTDLSVLCNQYDSVLSALLNKHAPLRTRSISVRPRATWYTDDIQINKTKRRNLERRWRHSKLTIDRELYVAQCNVVNKLIFEAKMNYFSKLITDAGSNSKDLFRSIDRLLHRTPEKKLPTSSSSVDLANDFVHFFKNKIVKIRNGFVSTLHPSHNFSNLDLPQLDCQLDSFLPISIDELSAISRKMSSKSCSLDPLPASILLNQFDVLLPTICEIVNKSLQSGVVPSSLKVGVLKPLLKKPSLNHEVLSNYRPISNLKNISKIVEKIASLQLNNYLSLNNLHEPFQSAYKSFHSCETALLRVQNDILQSIDNRSCVAMLLLDLSAAFDTVDHQILLNRLNTKFGISGTALQWFKSYLTNRLQFVSIDNYSSEALQLDCGVPQGSVLGPLLYLLYTSPVAEILRQHKMFFHLYADDTQLYIPFSCNDDLALNDSMKLIENCLSDIDAWMTINKLKLNKDKTEFLLFSSKHSPQLTVPSLNFGCDFIAPSAHVRNIGVIFDSQLTMARNVNNICKSSFYHLRNIAKIRKFISVETTEIIVHAFVSSKLDNCNSLLFGLPHKLLNKLQSVQNAAARIITLSRKHDHITPILVKLHWLPIESRIKYKILLLTYKALHGISPMNSFLFTNLKEVFVHHHNCYCHQSHIISNPMVIAPSLLQLQNFGTHYHHVSEISLILRLLKLNLKLTFLN